jgi:hypothetical protein
VDELVTIRPALQPKVGPAGHPLSELPPEFEVARRRLTRLAHDTAERLGGRLRRAIELHDLDRRELMAAQQQIGRLRRAGLLPSPADYWENTAVPRADILVDAAIDAVTEETGRLGEAIDRFLTATSRSTLEPWINGAEGRAAIQRSGDEAVERLLAAIPASERIDALGEWWQRKLQRRAVLRAAPRLLVSRASAEVVIGEAEVAILDSPPWSHGDRLLSAFELGHAEIRNRAVELTDALTARIDRRGQRKLVETRGGGPALIRLDNRSA